MATNLRNLFGTVVHDVPEGTTPVELRSTFGTVVHDVPEGITPVELRSTFGTAVHSVPPFSVFAADITGAIAVGAEFSASISGEWSSTPKTYPEVGFAWEFTSVPVGSELGKVPPLPDNSVSGGWTDMSDNTTLFHFNEDLDWDGSGSYSEDFESTSIGSLPAGWTTFGDAVWEVTGSDSHDGTKSIGSADIGDNQSVSVAYTASLAIPQTLQFWWKVSSENGFDFLRFYIDGVQQDQVSGPVVPWHQKSYNLPSGPSILTWTYSKDGSAGGGTDNAWVDDISIGIPVGSLAIAGSSSFSNNLVSNGAPVSGSNPAIVTSSLGDVRGIKLNQGVKMSTGLTASQLHVTGAEARTIMMWANIEQTSDNDDKFVFSYGSNTDKGQLGLRKLAMGGLPPAEDVPQGNLQRFESWTGADGVDAAWFLVPNIDQWRHWAVTYESGSSELVWYVDGEMVFVDPIVTYDNPAVRTILATADTAIFIGGDSHNAGTFTSTISASFSEFAVFSSSLPQSQIRDIYNKQKATGFYQDTWDQFPDSSVVTDWVDMSDNVILYHLDEVELSTQIGSVGLIDAYSDGWHGANWVSVLVNSIVVVSSATLGSGGGPEWYDFSAEDGDSVEIIFSSLGTGSPNWGEECSYSLNSGSAGSGVTFYTSGDFPTTPYSFTANGFLTGTLASTIQDSSGQGNDGSSTLNYTTAIVGPFSGSTAWSGSGANQISIGDLSITGSSGLSFSTWLKPTKNLTDEKFYIFELTNGSNQDISLRKDIGNFGGGAYQNVIFEIGAGSVTSRGMFDQYSGSVGGVPPESGWVHWVATADGAGSMSLYKDGELINSASGQGAIPDAIRNTNYIGIKSDLDSAWRYDGELSEFAMWERELSSYEVQKMYQHQYSGSSVYNSYGVDVYSNSASFLPDVDGDYTVKYTAFGSMATGSAMGSMGAAASNMLKLYLNITEIAWIYQEDPAAGGGGGGGGSTSPILPQTSGGPRIGSGFVINNYKAVSSERVRRVEQVPFKLGLKDKLGLRVAGVTGSTPTPTGDDLRVYGNVTEIAWIYKE